MRYLLYCTLILLLLPACGEGLPEDLLAEAGKLPERVDFNQHIRPILSDRCWSCHGPDAESRQAELRLDTEAGAFAALKVGSGHPIVAGKPGKSQALQRMLSDDPETVMPPPESRLTLTDREIALFGRWIEQGAEWKNHWSTLAIEDAPVPDNPAGYPAENEIDHFVNQELSLREIGANGRADHERLLRRLCLDLTGLPPSPALMDQWLRNPHEEAYGQLVDSLLATAAHAERLTMEWMDLARYADSHGLHADGWRLSWPYRDWVIQAFQDNLPFDRFVSLQLAGDLLPDTRPEDKIATAFNRMHPMTAEGGAIDEEFRLSYVFDRVNTVATGILGLTMDCSRCHDHKFDPISQEEYYGFSAFFNNVYELGMTGDDGNYGPYVLLKNSRTDSLLQTYETKIAELEAQQVAVTVNERELAEFMVRQVIPTPAPVAAVTGEVYKAVKDGQDLDKGTAWATKEVQFISVAERPGKVLEFDHPYDQVYFTEGIANIRTHEPISLSLHALTTRRDTLKEQTLAGNSGEKNVAWRGWEFYLDRQNRLNIRLIRTLPDDVAQIRSLDSLRINEWYQLGFTYDGSGTAGGLKLYKNGQPLATEVVWDDLRGEIYPKTTAHWLKTKSRKLSIGQSYRNYTGDNGNFFGLMDDIRVFYHALSDLEMATQFSGKDPVVQAENGKEHLRMQSGDHRKLARELEVIRGKKYPLMDTLPRLMITQDMERKRPTFVLNRGAYDDPRQRVSAQTPVSFLPFDADQLPPDRSGLAQWIFDPANPLTARVAVNRYWQLIFGVGLVDTPHDFGSQGSMPTHPALLDHLATELIREGWDIRQLLRKIVHSDTYRRSSMAGPEQREADPDNRWLARGPAYRMPAEFIRDNALAAAGLLHPAVGGPSVHPYQPEGLWFQSNNFSQLLLRYEEDEGKDLYRRSLYTFVKRTVPPPFMVNFDMAGRDVCVVKRSLTNTPLQALNLLNDPQFVEAARVLAQRVQQFSDDPEQQIARAFRLVTGRQAKTNELAVLRELYQDELRRFSQDHEAAEALLSVGRYPLAKTYDPPATAALASVGNTLFNFDEAYVIR